jgi:hypothetical protein
MPADKVIFIGSSNKVLEEVAAHGSLTFEMDLLFTGTGDFKIIAHVERIIEKKALKAKSKYEAPEIVLEEFETIYWVKNGLNVRVL